VRSTTLALLVLGVVVLMVVIYALLGVLERFARRRRYGAAFSRTAKSTWHRRAPIALTVGVVACLAIAFAQVHLNRRVTEASVVLAIDVSRSMSASDVQPTRLEAAQSAARAFLGRVPVGFRVGVVTFGNTPSVVIPPSTDRGRVVSALGSITLAPQTGTVIGDGLSTALDAIQADELKSGTSTGAVVLLSDGEDSGSTLAPADVAARAKLLGIPVFTVAISTSSQSAGAILLKQVADTTGGTTFTVQTAGQLTKVYEAIGPRLSYVLKVGTSVGLFMIAALVFAIAAATILLIWSRSKF